MSTVLSAFLVPLRYLIVIVTLPLRYRYVTSPLPLRYLSVTVSLPNCCQNQFPFNDLFFFETRVTVRYKSVIKRYKAY